MREVAATGDLTRKIALAAGTALGRRGRAAAGDDVQHADRLDRPLPARDVAEGAAVVARPAVDRDRARGPQPADDHQGGAARRCGSPTSTPARCARRSRDIDEEVARLNRIVNEVLDFARPIRFELAPADLNALCRESAAAPHGARRPARRSRCELDPALAAGDDRRRAAAASRWSTCWSTRGTRSTARRRRRRPAERRRSRLATRRGRRRARARIDRRATAAPGIDGRSTWRRSSTRTSPPSAAAPASACRSPRTSSKGWAARSPSRARRARHRDPRSSCPCRPRRR